MSTGSDKVARVISLIVYYESLTLCFAFLRSEIISEKNDNKGSGDDGAFFIYI